MNKNISVWRGIVSPPTHYHLWIKNDSNIYEYRDREWKPIYEESNSNKSGLMSKSDKQILDLLNKNLHWN